MLNSILKLFWANTKKQDDKRIATLTMPKGVYESNDHQYINDGNKYHQLDVYYPEGTTEKLPVIVDIHGGGWMYGDKELNKPYCLTLAKRGNVVFNMSYRLFPEVTPDEQLREIGKALSWIYNNLDNYPCDKKSICLTGDSAGGMLACFTAMLSVSEELRSIYDVEDFKLKFNAVALTSPVPYMDDGSVISVYTKHILGGNSYKTKKWANYVNADQIITLGEMPPTFLVTSSGDILALSQTLKTAKLFEEKGIEHKLMNWDKFDGKALPHVFPILYPESEPSRKTIDEMLAFFKKYAKQEETV
ncbi:MAG: alpha/beta hydrolase [Clostridia bacterium]|nr:alpha/beta hydrolase [Clostridia bacterium]